MFLWILLDRVTQWPYTFPWLSAVTGIGVTGGAIIFTIWQSRDDRATRVNFAYISATIRNGILLFGVFLLSISHLYQACSAYFGGFTSTNLNYQDCFLYQVNWSIDILLFNIADVFHFSLSPISPISLGAQLLVFLANLVLVTLVLGVVVQAFSAIQFWQPRLISPPLVARRETRVSRWRARVARASGCRRQEPHGSR